MLRKKWTLITIIVVTIISVFIYNKIVFDSIDYYLVAKDIPIYPTAINLQISGQSSEPMYHTRYGWITYKTNASQEDVLNFYKDSLLKRGWNFKKTEVTPYPSDNSIYYNSSFEKRILFKTYKLNINQEKTQSTYRKENAKNVSISIF